ncbi:hypothetical protein BDV25DRAFT_139457 [Aspergillus avenaceus]|uniref:Rhodopsin domain-containing protein n=1 Tax=Aspergillus avenaceus TaxID=36643 RepID=A0A5N6TWV0_ASPAV|nr:hypothetical protein BDV25DRAFT_139457 [Aspergillus avenaceus]
MEIAMDPRHLFPRSGDGTQVPAVLGVSIALMAFTAVIISIRLWVRIFILRAMGTDDVFMIIGTVLTFGLSIAMIIGTKYGIGKHLGDIGEDDYAVWVTRLLYVLAIGFVKLSLLWLFIRLDRRRWMRMAVYFMIFFVAGLLVGPFFVTVLSCTPPAKFWNSEAHPEGNCMEMDAQQRFYEAHGALNIVTDIIIWLLPMPMLWTIQMSRRKKIGVSAIFGLGVLSVAAACVRYDSVLKLANNKDQYYLLADSLNWCSIELYVAIFCGSAPALSVLIRSFSPRALDSGYREQVYGSRRPPSIHACPIRAIKNLRGRQSEDVELCSQDAIITDSEPVRIMMKTEIQMEVSDAVQGYEKQVHDNFERRA